MALEHPLFPVGLVVAGRACLVVGAGAIGTRKAESLLTCGADVTVVARRVDHPGHLGGARVECRAYLAGEAGRYRLVVAATGDEAVDARIAADAEAAGVWVNVADRPALCSVSLPAVLRQGPVTVAVATDGKAPAFASWLRDEIAHLLGDEMGAVAERIAAERAEVHRNGGSTEPIDWPSRIDELVGASVPTEVAS